MFITLNQNGVPFGKNFATSADMTVTKTRGGAPLVTDTDTIHIRNF